MPAPTTSSSSVQLVVDEGRASRLLRGIADRVRRLGDAAQQTDRDPTSLWLDGVKYLFVTAIEGCIDLAHHIASSEGWRAPDTNAGAVRLCGEMGVLDSETAEQIARAVGFRNVLVHQYAEVNDRIVVEALDQLDDLRAFVSQASAWVLNQSN